MPSETFLLLLLLLLVPMLLMTVAFADLQNPDFESSPSNITTSTTSPFGLLMGSNSLPGWTIEGTVQYVTSGPKISLPGNGHAVQLGLDGKINQTFKADKEAMQYILTFTLAAVNGNCSDSTSVVVGAPDSSSVFQLEQRYGKETWESHACYLGNWGDEEPINFVIQSQSTEADPNSTCGPVIDALILKKIGNPIRFTDNLLINGGFEVGPAFLPNSTEGVLLDEEPSLTQSALQQWSVIGTVKYIDSKHYSVPEGKAAIEIVSISGGVKTVATLKEGSTYNLEFVMGDANRSCVGEFIVGAQAGANAQKNFTMNSKGLGFSQNCSLTFEADSSQTVISFVSFTAAKSSDTTVFCGPVIDNVALVQSSNGLKLEIQGEILISPLVFMVFAFLIIG